MQKTKSSVLALLWVALFSTITQAAPLSSATSFDQISVGSIAYFSEDFYHSSITNEEGKYNNGEADHSYWSFYQTVCYVKGDLPYGTISQGTQLKVSATSAHSLLLAGLDHDTGELVVVSFSCTTPTVQSLNYNTGARISFSANHDHYSSYFKQAVQTNLKLQKKAAEYRKNKTATLSTASAENVQAQLSAQLSAQQAQLQVQEMQRLAQEQQRLAQEQQAVQRQHYQQYVEQQKMVQEQSLSVQKANEQNQQLSQQLQQLNQHQH